MEKLKVNVLWLYPDKMNLHGDRGNIMALSQIAPAMNIELDIRRANSAGEANISDDTDLIYIGSGQMGHMANITDDLRTIESDIKAYIERGGAFLIIGSSGCVMSKSFTRYDGSVYEGLGILDMTAKELNRTKMPYVTREVYGDDLYFMTNDGLEVAGCQIQCMDFNIANGTPFGKVIYGYGNNTADGTEGMIYRNVIFTNTVGPLLSLNPWVGVKILSDIASEKGFDISSFDENNISFMEFARQSMELKKQFIKEKHKLSGIQCNMQ